jgi:hypothetical protein
MRNLEKVVSACGRVPASHDRAPTPLVIGDVLKIGAEQD